MKRKNNNLEKRALLLSQMILNTADLYHTSEEGERGLLETLVGAAIWYLPNHAELFNKKISQAALISLNANPGQTKLVEEHAIPRKVAGRQLYTIYLQELQNNPEMLVKLYLDSFGRYNLVLKEENDRLKKFQKAEVFVTAEEAYRQAGIELVDFSLEEYQEFKKIKRTISKRKVSQAESIIEI